MLALFVLFGTTFASRNLCVLFPSRLFENTKFVLRCLNVGHIMCNSKFPMCVTELEQGFQQGSHVVSSLQIFRLEICMYTICSTLPTSPVNTFLLDFITLLIMSE
jgi:hypothetical protein